MFKINNENQIFIFLGVPHCESDNNGVLIWLTGV